MPPKFHAVMSLTVLASVVILDVGRGAEPSEKLFRGKTAKEWVANINSSNEETAQGARKELATVTAGVLMPTLLKDLKAGKFECIDTIAAIGLVRSRGDTGSPAASAASELLSIVGQRGHPQSVRIGAAQALGAIGPDAAKARNCIRTLRDVLKFNTVNDLAVDYDVRLAVINALADIGAKSKPAIRDLTKLSRLYILKDHELIRAVPSLASALKIGPKEFQDIHISNHARKAISQIERAAIQEDYEAEVAKGDQYRSWKSGKYTVKARLVGRKGERITLEKPSRRR